MAGPHNSFADKGAANRTAARDSHASQPHGFVYFFPFPQLLHVSEAGYAFRHNAALLGWVAGLHGTGLGTFHLFR